MFPVDLSGYFYALANVYMHMQVCLAMEERDPNAKSTASKLIAMFSGKFKDMQYTLHPASILGEAPGKSSNVGWAAQRFLEKYSEMYNWEHVCLTVMDSKYLSMHR